MQPTPAEALVHRARARSAGARVVRTFVSACTRCRVSCHEQQAGLSEEARMTLSLCAGVGTWTTEASSGRNEPGWCPRGWQGGFTEAWK